MRTLRSMRGFCWLCSLFGSGVVLCRVFISVGFAPPVLPVYEQPLCPEPGLMWTPAIGPTAMTATTGSRCWFLRPMRVPCDAWLLAGPAPLCLPWRLLGPPRGLLRRRELWLRLHGYRLCGRYVARHEFAYNTEVVHWMRDSSTPPTVTANCEPLHVAGGSRVAFSVVPGYPSRSSSRGAHGRARAAHGPDFVPDAARVRGARRSGSYVKNNGGHPAPWRCQAAGTNAQNMHQVQTGRRPRCSRGPRLSSSKGRCPRPSSGLHRKPAAAHAAGAAATDGSVAVTACPTSAAAGLLLRHSHAPRLRRSRLPRPEWRARA